MRWWQGDDYTVKNLVHELKRDFLGGKATFQTLIFAKHLDAFRVAISKACAQISNQGRLITSLLNTQKKREKEIERLRKRNWEIKSQINARAQKKYEEIKDFVVVRLNDDLMETKKNIRLMKKEIRDNQELISKQSKELEESKEVNNSYQMKLELVKDCELKMDKLQKRGNAYKANFSHASKRVTALKAQVDSLQAKLKAFGPSPESPSLDESSSGSEPSIVQSHLPYIHSSTSVSRSFARTFNAQARNVQQNFSTTVQKGDDKFGT